jgi:hypothetical protein
MADQYEHHGLSGEYVMLPSGELVPAAAEAKKTKPAPQAAKPAPKSPN